MSQRYKVSAGILAFRRIRDIEFLLAHPGGPYWRKRDEGAWSIPKGQVESEDFLACAQREFTEETGFVATGPFVTLTPRRQKSGKLVYVFAVEADFNIDAFSSNSFEMEWPPRSGKIQHFPEIDRIAYFDAPAARKVILNEQRDFIDELEKKISEQKN
jgi:predicted NUDIX family NTP pyrophosphohydrolase